MAYMVVDIKICKHLNNFGPALSCEWLRSQVSLQINLSHNDPVILLLIILSDISIILN